MAEKQSKFEMEDVPLILATLKRAHDAGKFSRLTVDFNKDGGVVSVQLETRDKVK